MYVCKNQVCEVSLVAAVCECEWNTLLNRQVFSLEWKTVTGHWSERSL